MADAECIRVRIDYETGEGDVVQSGYMLLDLFPSWAPFSCDRFLKLVDSQPGFVNRRFCVKICSMGYLNG